MDGQPGVLSVFTGGTPGAGAEQILEIVAAAKAAQHGNFGDGVICHQQHLGGLAQPDVIHMLVVMGLITFIIFKTSKFWVFSEAN